MRTFAVLAAMALIILPVAEALETATRGSRLQGSEIGDGAWDLGYYGCGVTIAIFDEGVDDKHPWLDGKVVAGVDTTFTQPLWTQANGGNPQPVQGTHGTPVAGMAASHYGYRFTSPDGVPDWPEDARLGSAPCTWLVDVQFNDIQGAGTAEMVAAFDWAIANVDNDWGDNDPSNDGIEIITMSWSPNDETDGTDPVCEAANRAEAAGIIVLGSAGNSGGEEKPDLGCPTGADRALSIANIDNLRTVTRDDDVIRLSSTWGPRTDDGDEDLYEELKPDVAAHGHGVISTNSALFDGTEYQYVCIQSDDGVPAPGPVQCATPFSGTSASTPFAAGVVAVMLDANANLTFDDVREILHQTAEPFPDQNASAPEINAKWHHQYGFGMIDARAAVELALVWPGMELGRDLDSDGVRDYRDAAPMNPNITAIAMAPGIVATGGQMDSDGDGIIDDLDQAPLDPTQSEVEDKSSTTPAPGLLLVVAALFMARRRR